MVETDQQSPSSSSEGFDPNEYVTDAAAPEVEQPVEAESVEPFTPEELAAAIAEATSFGMPPAVEASYKLQMANRSRRVIEILGGHRALARFGIGGGGFSLPPFLTLALTGVGVGAMVVVTRRAHIHAAKMAAANSGDTYRNMADEQGNG